MIKTKSTHFRWFALSALLAFTHEYSFSQAPSIDWENSFGGSLNEFAYSIKQIKNDAFLVAGYAQSSDDQVTKINGGDDYWIIVINKFGKLKLEKTLGGSNDDEAFSAIATTDGGFIVAGYSQSDDGDITSHHGITGYEDYWIVKLSARGKIQWEKSLGGTKSDEAYSILQTSDGGYIVAGSSTSNDEDVSGHHGFDGTDYWVVKLDPSGNIEWQKSLGGSSGDYPHSIQQTIDGGYVVAGYSFSIDGDVSGNHGSSDVWIVKLDVYGNIEWQKSFGGTYAEEAWSIQQTMDGGYIVGGYSDSEDGDVTSHYGFNDQPDYWVLKLDSAGNMQWQKSYGGYGSDYIKSIEETSDHGYIFTGPCSSNDGGDVTGHHGNGGSVYSDYWVVKTDSIGNLSWQTSLGGYDIDEAFSLLQTSDGAYVIAGASSSHTGDVERNHGYYDYWVVKLESSESPEAGRNAESLRTDELNQLQRCRLPMEETVENGENSYFDFYPNPTSGNITLHLSLNNAPDQKLTVAIFNSFGKVVLQREAYTRSGQFEWSVQLPDNIPDGLYLVKMEMADHSFQQPFVLQQ